MFIKYSTSQIPPKKSKGKGSQGKKTADTLVADVEVSEESDSEPARKRTASRRVVKKKVTISVAENTIPDLDVALELGKFISSTEAVKEEAARQVHATHARIVTESETAKKKTSSRRTREQEATDIMQTLTESKKTSRRQPGTRGSSEGTGVSPRVPDESIVVPATSSEGTDSEYSEEDQGNDEEVDWIDSNEDEEKKDDTDDDKIIDLEMTDDEETNDEFVHGVEQVNGDEDEEMTNTEVEESGNGDKENIDAEKTDAGKTEEVKDDAKKAELPPTSSSLSVSLGFGDQFLELSSDTSLIGTVKDTTNAEINSLLDIKIQSEVPHIQPPILLQTTKPIPSPPITTEAPTITTVVPESDAFTAVQLRVTKLEKDVTQLNKIDHSAEVHATLKSQVTTIVEHYLGSKVGDDLQKTSTIDLEQESEKSASEICKIKKEQNPANHALYHALIEALIEDKNAIDKGVADTVKNHKRQHDDDEDNDEDPSAGPNQEPIKEPIAEVVIDDLETTTNKDVVNDVDRPQDSKAPKTNKPSRDTWFKQPPRPPTRDPEWNKRQVVTDQPE
ncbi:hypothetical protein Tco_1437769 [Tanacetum coccineum]